MTTAVDAAGLLAGLRACRLLWGHREARGRVLLLPVGSLEDRPRGPVALDTLLALLVSCLAAEELDALVAWPLGYGYSPLHKRWAGPRSPEALGRLVAEIVEGLQGMGASAVVVVDGHYGHRGAVRAAAAAAGAGYVNAWEALIEETRARSLGEQLRLEEELWETLASGRLHPLLRSAAERVAGEAGRLLGGRAR